MGRQFKLGVGFIIIGLEWLWVIRWDCKLFLVFILEGYNILYLSMDANQRKRKAPPLPKFQQPAVKDPKVVEKVADFLQEISKQVSAQQAAQKLTPIPPPAPAQTDKKKFNLASLNSKLNSIMSTKKIDLNKVVQNSKKAEQSQTKQRRDIEIQYDPGNPNSYQQSKSHYVDIFQKLRSSVGGPKQSDLDQRISKLIAEFQRDGEEIQEQMDQEPMIPEPEMNQLDGRESLALRMMQKYGFKVGEGLGKQSQGIKTPLTIKKLTDSSCKIELSELSLANFITVEQTAENALKAFKVEKSQVIALKIVMKLNELTDQVELEIKEQCGKYGRIMEWIALSVQDAIIFFCQYKSIDQAFKAFTRLNGRYYDQKIINVFFYPHSALEQKNFRVPLHQIIEF